MESALHNDSMMHQIDHSRVPKSQVFPGAETLDFSCLHGCSSVEVSDVVASTGQENSVWSLFEDMSMISVALYNSCMQGDRTFHIENVFYNVETPPGPQTSEVATLYCVTGLLGMYLAGYEHYKMLCTLKGRLADRFLVGAVAMGAYEDAFEEMFLSNFHNHIAVKIVLNDPVFATWLRGGMGASAPPAETLDIANVFNADDTGLLFNTMRTAFPMPLLFGGAVAEPGSLEYVYAYFKSVIPCHCLDHVGELVRAKGGKLQLPLPQPGSKAAIAEAEAFRKAIAAEKDDDGRGADEVGMGCKGCGEKESKERKLMKCTACRKVAYCSKECQLKDWKLHKPLCGKPRK